jgi:hypothetical protein
MMTLPQSSQKYLFFVVEFHTLPNNVCNVCCCLPVDLSSCLDLLLCSLAVELSGSQYFYMKLFEGVSVGVRMTSFAAHARSICVCVCM